MILAVMYRGQKMIRQIRHIIAVVENNLAREIDPAKGV